MFNSRQFYNVNRASVLTPQIRAIWDNMCIGVAVVDADGICEYMNPIQRRADGFTRIPVEGQHITSLYVPHELEVIPTIECLQTGKPLLKKAYWYATSTNFLASTVTDFFPLFDHGRKDGVIAFTIWTGNTAHVSESRRPLKPCNADAPYNYYTFSSIVGRDEALQALTSLCKDEDYRKMMFPIFHFNKDEVMQIGMKDIYFEPVTLTLDRSQQNELLSAYEKDVMAASIPDMQYESPLGELILFTEDSSIVQTGNSSGPNLIQTGQFYIYRSYKNTLTLLEDYGYTLREEIDPKDVMFMTYYPTENSESDNYARKEIIDYDFGEGISITKPEEIKELLGRISYDECNGILGGRIKAVGSVEITLREKSYPNSYAVSE